MILRVSKLGKVLLSLIFAFNLTDSEYLGGEISSCGLNAIPYSLTVDTTGHPGDSNKAYFPKSKVKTYLELLCDTPACFDWPSNRERLSNDNNDASDYSEGVSEENLYESNADFYNPKNALNNNFVRRHRREDFSSDFVENSKQVVVYNTNNSKIEMKRTKRDLSFNGKTVQCSGRLTESACSAQNDWTGSIAEWNNGTHISLRMECCRFDGLSTASELKIVVLQPGQQYKGGVVQENGKSIAFDLIKEIRKNVTENNQVKYVIKVYRIVCTENSKSKVDSFYEENKDIYQNDRLRPSASMLRMAMTKKHPVSESYLQKIRMAAAASQIPKFHRFPHLAQHHKMLLRNGQIPSERRRHPSLKPTLADRDSYVRGNIDNRRYYLGAVKRQKQISRHSYNPSSSSMQDEFVYYDANDDSVPRQQLHKRRPRPKTSNEQLWPIRLSPPIQQSSKLRSKSRLFAANEAYNSDGYKSLDEEYQVLEATSHSPLASTIDQHVEGGSPPPNQQAHDHSAVIYENATPLSHHPISALQDGYQSVNSYAQPPPPVGQAQLLSTGSAAVNGYETPPTNYQLQNVQQDYQQPYIVEQQQCTSSCSSQSYCASGGGGGGQSCCCSNLNGAFSALQCFSGDMTVQTRDEGIKRVDQLQIGDYITYSPVVMFLHRKPEEAAVYLKVETENGQILKITDYHLIYVSKCKNAKRLYLVQARKLKLGECVYIVPDSSQNKQLSLQPSRIVQITNVNETGIYAPLTANGDIIINEVLASCHSNVAAQTLQQTFFAWWRSINAFTLTIVSLFNIETPFSALFVALKLFGKTTSTTPHQLNNAGGEGVDNEEFLSLSSNHFENELSYLASCVNNTNNKENNEITELHTTSQCSLLSSSSSASMHSLLLKESKETVSLLSVKKIQKNNNNVISGEIPFGVEYLTQVIDVLVPISAF